VLERERLEVADRSVEGTVQPYHWVEEWPLAKADAFLARCRDTSLNMAKAGVGTVAGRMRDGGYDVVAACVLESSGRPAGSLADILASHAMIHTAEGVFYRDVFRKACEAWKIPVIGVKEREIWNRAAESFGEKPEELQRMISALGKDLGPPWRQDEKLATAAAWLALSP